MSLYETLIRVDFLLAVGLLVLGPLVLLGMSLFQLWIRDRLLAYWRASSLLGITVYLWIDTSALGFLTGYAARAAIPVALWWGDALSSDRSLLPPADTGWQAAFFQKWRIVATVYSGAGLVYMLPLLSCAWFDAATMCSAWYLPPQEYARLMHPYTAWARLSTYGQVVLAVYTAYAVASAYALWTGPRPDSSVPGSRGSSQT